MKEQEPSAEQTMAEFFEGRDRLEQMALMSRLEMGGGSLYRRWAETERNAKAREKLIEAAEREESNADLLRLMTSPKSACEKCQISLISESSAFCCSLQCTFCPQCAGQYAFICPMCGGELNERRVVQTGVPRQSKRKSPRE
jgi:uncharacterized protein